MRPRMITALAVAAVGTVGWGATVRAQPSAPTTPPAASAPASSSTAAATAPAPAPAPRQPVSAPALLEPAAPAAERVGPIPTADEAPAASDHDAVVGHVGVEARRFAPGPIPFGLRPGTGCPADGAGTPACEVTMGAVGARYWWTRNLAVSAGLALAVGGGRDATQGRDTYLGLGPIVGLSLLLGNWRHLAVSASPELAFVWFKPTIGGDADSTKALTLRGALEAEVHLGFVGVPALSLGLLAGLGFQYQSAGEARAWSIGVLGGDSVWGALSNLFVRYYL